MTTHYGKDCPTGMVQIEFVGCDPKDKQSEYGWKPTTHATVDIYIDGERFFVDVGDFHDGVAKRRGLHIVGPIDMRCEKTSINACTVYRGDGPDTALRSPAPAATVTGDIGDKRALFPDGVRTFNQQLKRITDVACVCPKCKWSGKVFDCEPDVDGDGGLGCPKCNTVVVCEGDAPAQGWRLLEVGEVIREGDEYYWYGKWIPFSLAMGRNTEIAHAPIRRRLTPPAQGDEMRALCDAVTEWANNVDQYNQRDENEYCLVGDDELELLRSAVAAVREGSE